MTATSNPNANLVKLTGHAGKDSDARGLSYYFSLNQDFHDATGEFVESIAVADGRFASIEEARQALRAALPAQDDDGKPFRYVWIDANTVEEVV